MPYYDPKEVARGFGEAAQGPDAAPQHLAKDPSAPSNPYHLADTVEDRTNRFNNVMQQIIQRNKQNNPPPSDDSSDNNNMRMKALQKLQQSRPVSSNDEE